MPLKAPELDTRRFDDLLREAQERIVRYSRGAWTDFNDSDPGMTLVQLFAWLTESMLYQFNQVPERNYVKFLELLNVRPVPAKAATARITFVPARPKEDAEPTVIPEGTAAQAEAEGDAPPPVFETTEGFTLIRQPLAAIQVFDGSDFRVIQSETQPAPPSFRPFGWVPQQGSALYLGFQPPNGSRAPTSFPQQMRLYAFQPNEEADRRQIVSDAPREAFVAAPPRTVWEYKLNDTTPWRTLPLFRDDSEAFTREGYILVQGPPHIEPTRQGKVAEHCFWIRCRLQRPDFPSGRPPLIEALLPNTVDAENLSTIRDEILGTSEGVPDQVFRLGRTPVDRDSVRIEVTPFRGAPEPWKRVDDFFDSKPDSPDYTLEPGSGEIRFGDGQHGRIPLAGAEIRAVRYRTGGGTAGNVGKRKILQPVRSPVGVEEVFNHRAASGGRNEETLEQLRRRVPQLLKGRGRAVTVDDFEQLAKQAGEVQEAASLPRAHPRFPGVDVPGAVTVVVVPDTVRVPPRPSPELLQQVCNYLHERRLITTELYVTEPKFIRIEVQATVSAQPGLAFDQVKLNVLAVIEDLFNPYSQASRKRSGTKENSSRKLLGVDFDPSDLIRAVRAADGVRTLESLRVHVDGTEHGDLMETVPVPPDTLVYALPAEVTVIPYVDR